MRIRALLCLALVAGLSLLAGGSARASMMIQLVSSGGPGLLVTDNVAPDLDPTSGAITTLYNDSVFSVATTTGTSKPLLGGPGLADMDLNNITVDSKGAGTLTVYLTDTGFNGLGFGGLVTSLVGGTLSSGAGSSVSFRSYIGPADNPFALTIPFSPLGPFGPGAFSGATSDPHGPLGNFSMTQVATIVFTGKGSASFDYETLSTVPEPSSLALAALGSLGAVGFVLRRRRPA
jgi:hypothetical protein